MRWPRLSLQIRVVALIMTVSVIALAITSAGIAVLARVESSQQLAGQLESLADLVGAAGSSALESGDAAAGQAALSPLQSVPFVDAAVLVRPDGNVLARYIRAAEPVPSSDGPAGTTAPVIDESPLVIQRDVAINGRSVGSIEVQGSQLAAAAQFERFVVRLAIAAGAALFVALLLAVRLQRRVTGPILELVHMVKRIVVIGDFRVRAERRRSDELGDLIEQFNELLSQIERRETALAGTREQIDERVKERTKTLESKVEELKRIEDELVLAKAAAEEANIAKSDFLANMSHELRTPLNAILGYGEMLKEDAVDQGEEQFAKDLDQIIIAGRHLLSLINAVLDLSKIEAGRMNFEVESFDLAQFVRDLVELTTPLALRNQNEFRVGRLDDLGLMHTDRTKVQQILINLLGNACKFTKGGLVQLDVTHGGDLVDEVTFRIHDTGIGISEEQQAQLFRDFSRADTLEARQNEGTGLGLAISQRLCRLLGGRIEMQSTLGTGSTFTVFLPAKLEVPKGMQEQVNAEGPVSTPGTRPTDVDSANQQPVVLVIDDDASARDLAGRIIARAGFRAMEAPNAEDGLQLLKAFPPAAVLLDVILPDVDGWTLLRRMRKMPELADLPVIVTSVTDDRRRSMSLGATDHMTKPFDALRLIQTLRKAIGEDKRHGSGSGSDPVAPATAGLRASGHEAGRGSGL